jgi:hypothetical protein
MIGTREGQYAKSVIGMLHAQELAIRVADTSRPDLQSRSQRDVLRMLKEHCQSQARSAAFSLGCCRAQRPACPRRTLACQTDGGDEATPLIADCGIDG